MFQLCKGKFDTVSALCYHLTHWHVKLPSCRAIEEKDKINVSVQ